MKDNKIIFFGSDYNSAQLLEKLINNKLNLKLVITKSEKNTGRKQKKNLVKKIAQENNIDVLEKDKITEKDFEQLKNIQADLGVLLSYGAIIPQEIIDIFPLGILNIHPSLLPKYRGSSPVQTSLLNGDQITGVSVMLLSKKMDAGPILLQEKINISENDNYKTLSNKLFELGDNLLIGNLENYINKEIIVQDQNHTEASFTKMLNKEDSLIDWNKSAREINNKIKAFYGWLGTYTFFNNKKLKIIEATTSNKTIDHKIGEVFLDNQEIGIQTGKEILYPKIIQIEGKQKTDIKSFANGYQDFIGSILK